MPKMTKRRMASSAAPGGGGGGGGGGRFGAILRRNTHRMTFVLIYTLLEWLLIALLLLNGLLSYLISRFASFFGLAPPCAFCSRLDRLFDPAAADCRRLLCDAHAADVSRLAFCSLHRRLAPAADMCDHCSASRPAASDRSVALLSYTKKKTKRDDDDEEEREEEEEEEEERFTCSCCEADLGDGEFGSPYFLLKPSWDAAGAGREEYDVEGLDGDVIFEVEDGKIGNVLALALDREEKRATEFSDSHPRPLLGCDNSVELVTSRIESEPHDEERRIPLELIDSTNGVVKATLSPALSSRAGGGEEEEEEEDDDGDGEGGHDQFILEEKVVEDYDREIREETVLDHQTGAEASLEGEAFDWPGAREEDNKSTDVEATCESEICEQEQPEQARFQEQVRESANTEDQTVETFNDAVDEGQAIEPELNEVDEDRTPETPTHGEAIHGLHKRFFFERRESGAESFDGSVAGELDGGEPSSVDQFKSALKSERKALNALYAELEEERSASAVAASETMAMINRLQEEKAAMKMEALQYQRMMEEQSEYDQEALQLLNELLVKREKEKQGLEKELEVCREKVLIYETKERKRMERQQKQNGKSGLLSSSSSSSSSSAEESDDLLFDYCERGDLVRSRDQSNVTTPDAETAKHLVDGSLADFEEERLSILEQLKTLEERLFALENDDSDYVKMTESFSEGNPHESNGDYGALVDDLDVPADRFSDDLDDNGGKFQSDGKYASCRGKRLLPLFDAAALETEDGASAKQDAVQESTSPKAVSELAKEQEKLLIAEEIDDLYDRLQALEADREFLKHCVKSLKKGDKGLNLLEEILQHLRDLRSVELRVRKAGDDAPALLTV